jgi:methylenetetrahydrofolate reductase (NADPH)
MRDDNHFLDQREIKCAPQLFLGAAGSPFASEVRFQAIREEKKVNAGAQFFQTNLIYDVDGFERYLEALDKRDVLKRVYLLAGINPIRSIKAAHKLNQVPGIHIPKEIITRIENSSDAKEEGIQLTLEIIERIKALPSISGIHFMTVGWENVVPRLIEESGLRKL